MREEFSFKGSNALKIAKDENNNYAYAYIYENMLCEVNLYKFHSQSINTLHVLINPF